MVQSESAIASILVATNECYVLLVLCCTHYRQVELSVQNDRHDQP